MNTDQKLQEFTRVSTVLADMADALESKARVVLTPFSELLDDADVYDGQIKSEHEFYGVVNEQWLVENTAVSIRNVLEELDFVRDRLTSLLAQVDKLS